MAKEKPKTAVPKLRFPEFREETSWAVKSLNAVCEINPSNEGLPESFIYIDLGSVEDGVLNARKLIEKRDAPSRAQRLLKNGDIVFQVVRPYQRNNLFAAFDDNEAYVASTGYAQLRSKECDRFLFQSIHVDGFVERVVAKCTGSSYPAINSSDLANVLLPIPATIREQKKIADCLTSLDELIAAQGRKVDALKTYKRGLMQQLFPREGETVPQLRLPEFHDPWREVAIGEICISISSGKDLAVAGGDFDLYGSTGVIGKTDNATYIGEYLLVARVGANAGFLNRVSGSFGASDNTLVVHLREEINLEFIGHYLDNFKLNKLSFGSGQPLITGGQIKALKIRIPSLREQFSIASIFASLDNAIAAENRMCDNLKIQKQAIMQQLFPVLDER